jgi:hypothetical protein
MTAITTTTKFQLVTLTGATLVYADGTTAGPEIGRVISTHRSKAAAERAAAAYRRAGPCGYRVMVRAV